MSHSARDATHRKQVDSRSTDDYQYSRVRERSRKSLPSSRTPSPSLRSSASRHADIHDDTPGRIVSSPRNPSVHSSLITSPSSTHGDSSRFTDSQSSLTSESAGAGLSRSGCEDGSRLPATMMRPPNFGTPPSPVPGRSRSITESDLRFPTHGSTRKSVSACPTSSPRPRTAPHSHSPAASTENHDSHVIKAIKSLLSKPALPLPTHLSQHSPPASEASSPSRHAVFRRSGSHPIELDVSASPFSPGHTHPEVPLASQGSLQSPSSSSTPIQGNVQKPRNVLRRKPSAKAKEKERIGREIAKNAAVSCSSSTHGSMSVTMPKESPSGYPSDRSMTPAGTGAQAHKQREDSPVQLAEAHDANESVPPSPVPYYTVYGTRSEHKVTADGPDDTRQWLLHEHILAGQRAQAREEEPARPLARKGSLTRMVSSRWKKTTGTGKADESRPPSCGHSKSRSSLQERHSSRDRRESIHSGVFGTDLHQTRSVIEPQNTSREEPVESSKIWRLIKRISTGGMRERFIADKAAPPVPVIPKELLNRRSPQSQALRDGPRKSYSPSTPKNIANSGPRPSMATSSSSPNSSDMASAHFFRKSLSRRSSVSSYGEDTAPLSGFSTMAQEGHHIASDQKKDLNSISRSRSCSHPGKALPKTEDKTNSEDQPPRVVPPVDDPWEMPPRTVSTSSVAQPSSLRTHKFGVRPPRTVPHAQLLPDGNVSLSPPPRPARSVMRSSRVSRNEGSPFHSRPATADGKLASQTSLRTCSTVSDVSTVTLQPLSNSVACTSERARDSSHIRSGINFRELSATPRRAPLTEREKAEIWDDLLERSAQAGGTLHFGASGQLESDNLRYSSCSEVSRVD